MKRIFVAACFAVALFILPMTAFADGHVYRLRVDGLACPFCAYGVEKKLSSVKGVEKLTLDIDAPTDLPLISADPDEMRRVLVNLVGNAVEALDHREGTLSARVTQDGEWVVLTLIDDGPGIDAASMPRIFEPNFSTKTGGTGLGLAICKRAVHDLGGSITIDSRPGHGATVTVRLPALQ